jgi:hypothetical protein
MATTWPPVSAWPIEPREHAAKLSKHLSEALCSMDQSRDQTVPATLVKAIIIGITSLVSKIQKMPDLRSTQDTLNIVQAEARAAAEDTRKALQEIKEELKEAKATHQLTGQDTQECKVAARESTEMGRTVMAALREIKGTGAQATGQTYASVASRGLASSMHNTQYQRPMNVQTQREVIVNIRDPLTIANLRAMNPRNLKAHVDRAVEQSENEHVRGTKVVSANQLRSGDLSVKTATTKDMETLRQFADDWAHHIGNRTSVQVPTYGIIAHGIRTSSMDTEKFEETRDELLMDNKPFVPNAEIKYIGWLSKAHSQKPATSVIIEFTTPEDANRIIDEGLIWQGQVFHCERYDRASRLKQCYNCQAYGHIGTQCKATTACGWCAGDHSSRDCPQRDERTATRKCAMCSGAHNAWNHQCPTRREEMAKIKAKYDSRPIYHPVPNRQDRGPEPEARTATQDTSSRSRGPIQARRATASRGRSLIQRGQKRDNTGDAIIVRGDESDLAQGSASQRPNRTRTLSRRAIEGSYNQPMDISYDSGNK